MARMENENILLPIYILTFIPGFIGNLLTLTTAVFHKKMRQKTIVILMGSLAASDLINYISFFLPTVVGVFLGHNITQHTKKFHGIVLAAFFITAMHFILIAANRYLCICRPHSTLYIKATRTTTPTIVCVVTVWTVVGGTYMVLVYTQLLCYNYSRQVTTWVYDAQCPAYHVQEHVDLVYEIVALVSTCVLYGAVIVKLVRQKNTVSQQRVDPGNDEAAKMVSAIKNERAITIQLLFALLVFAGTVVVYHVVYIILPELGLKASFHWEVVALVFIILHFSINPTIYFSRNHEFRQATIELLRGAICSLRKRDPS